MGFKATDYFTCSVCGKGIAKGSTDYTWLRSGPAKGTKAHQTCANGNGAVLPTTPNTATTTSDAGILDTILRGIRESVEKQVLDILADTNSGIDEAAIVKLIEQYTPKAREVVVTNTQGERVNVGLQHKQFDELLEACTATDRSEEQKHLNVWITGPAGTGKTSACKAVAKALGMDFDWTNALTDMYKLWGFKSITTGDYQTTAFRRIWEHGGIWVFDDFDRSDAQCATEANAPLANGYCSFPDGMIPRHPNCIIILTANTWGLGPTGGYVGAVKMDEAFIDRFVFIDWEIDEDLERQTCGNEAWARRVQSVRAKVKANGLKVLVTPRATYNGIALLDKGWSWEKVERATMALKMKPEQWAVVGVK